MLPLTDKRLPSCCSTDETKPDLQLNLGKKCLHIYMEQINVKICRKFRLTHFRTCLPLLMICTAVTGSTALVNTNETDRQALLAVKDLISGDPLAVLSSWNQSVHFCHWQGVTCGVRHQRVTGLDLSSQELVGSLSPQIGNLTFLRAIRLDNIPRPYSKRNWSTLSSEISFPVQQFLPSGNLPPDIGLTLPNLQLVGLGSDNFSGPVPPSIVNASGLVNFDISANNFSKLTTLFLGENHISGTIPRDIGNLFMEDEDACCFNSARVVESVKGKTRAS
ncbi:hypothetical protein RJ640_002728 [Escallonia rubra]|uniref:Leucine-rich repeat-containing N-terminal plant-type domain-containing protein n=1 Tax=Escallonia rubra TaxID=112253 RepID=A0AA88RLL4_9ASTE|nr:hypothetical protein RJ640_002728 [Escallonia rubra]